MEYKVMGDFFLHIYIDYTIFWQILPHGKPQLSALKYDPMVTLIANSQYHNNTCIIINMYVNTWVYFYM